MAENTENARTVTTREMILQKKSRARSVKILAAAWAAIALWIFCEPLRAQESAGDRESSATAAETIEWLRSTINNQVLVDVSGETCRNSLDFRDGILRYKATCSRPGTKTSYIIMSVPLKAVDPLTIKVTHELSWAVRFSTSMSKPVISWDGDGTDGPRRAEAV